MKVLHLPDVVGGNATGLAQGERAIGLDSQALCLFASPYGYAADIRLGLERRGRLGRTFGRLDAFRRLRRGFDVYHFNYGSSLLHAPHWGLPLADLPYYDRNAKIVFTWQGCDARQKYPTMARNRAAGCEQAACFVAECHAGLCNSGRRDAERRKAIDKASRYAHHMFALNPDLLYFLPREISSFLPYCIADYERLPRRTRPFFQNGVARIAHAPTDRGAKGTALILRVLESLKEEFGDRLETVLIENQPRHRALALYAGCDLVVDQLLVGWYGAVAVEAMKLGVPVATFINDDHLRFVPPEMASDLPFLRVDRFSLQETLRGFLKDRAQADAFAARGEAFVERWHKPARVAQTAAAVYGAPCLASAKAALAGVA